MSASMPILLVTANVGSIFEDPSDMLKIWTCEFLKTIAKLEPKFIALHCQEVGGKNYENSMKHVKNFVDLLMSSDELREYDKIRVYLDEDYSSAENFTALGNLYFIHESVDNVKSYDFSLMDFVGLENKKEIYSGNIEDVSTKEKAKFPQDFFPECKWSRKGFLRTRWSLNNTIFDLVNIHLFHDASNFIAMEKYPSVYCKNRRRALEHTLQRFHNDQYGKAPLFVFGDFNFRTDTEGVVKSLTEGTDNSTMANPSKYHYSNENGEVVLTVGKKEFKHLSHERVFVDPSPTWLIKFDKEPEAFKKHLFEYPITFRPSYPFEEKISEGSNYMKTRCPAWCDRVLLSHTAKQLVRDDNSVEYALLGLETCMGDHKPVYLKFDLKGYLGTVLCCNHADCCASSSSLPANAVSCTCCKSFASVIINIIDMSDYSTTGRRISDNQQHLKRIDSKLLHEHSIITKDMLMHEPYTPESIESHSPLNETIIDDEKFVEKLAENIDDEIVYNNYCNLDENDKLRRSSVSPTLLKSRLELVLLKSEFKKKTNEEDEVEKKRPHAIMTRSVSENERMYHTHLLTARTNGDGGNFFRTRAMSEVTTRMEKLNSEQEKSSRMRLISTASNNSMNRYQSHHSSSDEDWFEYDSDVIKETVKHHKDETNDDDDINSSSNESVVDNIASEVKLKTRKKLRRNNNNNHFKCCIIM